MESKTHYQPLEDRVVIRPLKKSEMETTEGGIIVPFAAKKDVAEGIVFAEGSGVVARENGVLIPNILAKGDMVLFGASQGMPLTLFNEEGHTEEMKIMREGDVLMVIKKADTDN